MAWAAIAMALVLLADRPAASDPRASRTSSFPFEYVPPEQESYRRVYDVMRQRRVLERLSQALAFIHLPAPLHLRAEECGESNAIYDDDDETATLCYEYADELARHAAGAEQHGFSADDALLGPLVFIYLHEIGHALFHLLDVPILGREEDAADQVAALILLRVGRAFAKDTLATTVWMYEHSAKSHVLDESDFSDVHPLDAQRYYNLLCLAYGADPGAYGAAVASSELSPARAEGCESEYRQVTGAVRRLLAPRMGPRAFRGAMERPDSPRR
jgi:hypothetical protein